MAFKGVTHSIPSTVYGAYIDVMEATGWTWYELLDQPADLIDEMLIRMNERNKQEFRLRKAQQQHQGHFQRR